MELQLRAGSRRAQSHQDRYSGSFDKHSKVPLRRKQSFHSFSAVLTGCAALVVAHESIISFFIPQQTQLYSGDSWSLDHNLRCDDCTPRDDQRVSDSIFLLYVIVSRIFMLRSLDPPSFSMSDLGLGAIVLSFSLACCTLFS